MQNVSIRLRLFAIVGLMALLTLAVGATGLLGITLANRALEENYRNRLEPTQMIGRIMLLMNDNRAQVMLALQHQPGSPFVKMHEHPIALHTDAIAANRDEITAIVAEYRKRSLTPEEQALADRYAAARGRYVEEGLKASREALLAGDYESANLLLLSKVNPLYAEAAASADALLQKTLEIARRDYAAAEARYVSIRNASIGGTALGILIALLAGALLIRSITQPLGRAVGHFERIADGELGEAIAIPGRDEIGRVLAALAEMQTRLKRVIGDIAAASSGVNAGAANLGAGMRQVVEHSETQNARAQEIAAAMEEVSQSVCEVAANAEDTASAALSAQGIVRGSVVRMEQSIAATGRVVDAVQASSGTITELSLEIQRIGEVTRTIKEIAEQTNLLALNAAIEAARAGEQGRGFAVVADEVRKLAERTSASTADISQTVAQIQRTTGDAVASMERAVREVEEGIGMMKASGASFEQITANSDHVTEMAQSIASAARQQSVATESVAANMEQISVLIDENTHAARQAWTVAEELGQTANALHAIVARFRGVA
ncbi:MAG: hypothetical protein BGO63_00135 [Candidatus Accumulibacter sp. 66-26]|nr:methyl-accepting chemotaxis protein [Accumulibacter sp.]OJW47614.1 MAG: hypothetical protein BGO63_00135 [Candidatus Accumulibacter sp. 66-26]